MKKKAIKTKLVNLFRMRQIYEVYKDNQIVAPLVRQLSWMHHLIVLSRCKRTVIRHWVRS